MDQLFNWLLAWAARNAQVIAEAPVAFGLCVVVGAAVASLGFHRLLEIRYQGTIDHQKANIEQQRAALAYLQRKLDDVTKENAQAPAPAKLAERDLDGLYQFGVLVGRAEEARIDVGRGLVWFGQIRDAAHFNMDRDFEYKGFTLKIVGTGAVNEAVLAGQQFRSLAHVRCEIVGRVSV